MHHKLRDMTIGLQPWVDAITYHPVFDIINSLARLRRFTEIHVYAVWDFMSLLKALQRKLTSQQLLWSPPKNHLGCYLVNTLIAEEESDCIDDDRYLSHFELYLAAMQQCGANTDLIDSFITHIQQAQPLSFLLTLNLPPAAKSFIQDTFTIIEQAPHAIAASLAFAREQITSGMFSRLLENLKLSNQENAALALFQTYLQRHIELDSGKHHALSQRLVASLCGTDEDKWQVAQEAAWFSLESRLALLDGIYQEVREVQSE